jgi:APA family basic amino acid/polyamine antiporter
VKIAILLVVIALGIQFIDSGNWTPFAPNGMGGIQAGAAIIFFAFIGFDAVSTTAEETRDPGRDLPRGILWSLGICTVLYVLVTAVVTGMVPFAELANHADPLAYVFEKNDLRALAGVIAFGAVVATTTALLVYQVGQPRIFLAMARDGLLNNWFAKVHPKHGTPSNATIFTGFLVAIPAGLLNIDIVVELTNIGTLFAFGLVCVSVLVLRHRRPEATRRFRAPLIWVTAPLGVLACLWLAMGLPWHTWVRFVLWLAAGLVFYFAYGFWKSRLREQDGRGAA